MDKVRFRYSKTGRAKFISHLDLMSAMQRAFIRAGIKLKYSEGFNPHPYMSVALPLSVGSESICELIDVGVADDVLPNVKKITFPDGLALHEIYRSVRKFGEISWIEINGKMHYDSPVSFELKEKVTQRFSEDRLIVAKRTKRGTKELDIAPFIKDAKFCIDDDALSFSMKISATDPAINSADLANIFISELKPVFLSMKRINLYDSGMNMFS